MHQQESGLLMCPSGEHPRAVSEDFEVPEVRALNICLDGHCARLEHAVYPPIQYQVDWLEEATEGRRLVDAVDVLARIEVLQFEGAHQARDEGDLDVSEERVVKQVVVEHVVQNLPVILAYF